MATPERAREAIDQIRATGAERGVVVAFGQLLPTALLDAFPKGLVNLHYSLLPRWRGAAPVERAILAGDTETGVCVMDVEPTLDTGAVYARRRRADRRRRDRGRAARVGSPSAAPRCSSTRCPTIDTITPEPQSGEPTYADKLTVDEFRLDLDASRRRADPHGAGRATRARARGSTSTAPRLKVWRAHEDDDGRFVPDEVQPQGKKPMPYAAWKAGHRGADPFA